MHKKQRVVWLFDVRKDECSFGFREKKRRRRA